MTPDTTGHGTQDAGHVLRPPAPTQATHGVPYPRDFWEADEGHGTYSHEQGTPLGLPRDAQDTSGPDPLPVLRPAQDTTAFVPQDTQQDTLAPVPQDTRGVPQDTKDASRWSLSGLVNRTQDAIKRHQDSVRSTEDAHRAIQQQTARDAQDARDALSRESNSRRRRASTATATADQVAPLPDWMKVAQIWVVRFGGFALKLSPLIASGIFTYQVGTSAPLSMDHFTAIFLVGGLEGAVWYLNVLREKFKLENDSTLSIALVIAGIITLIFTLIGGHALWQSAGAPQLLVDFPGTDQQVPVAELVPALAIALMSAIGAFIWAKEATYKHRTKLRALGQIDPRAPRISAGAWVFTWWESIWSLRHAFKYRVTRDVTADWRHWKAAGKPKIWPVPDGFRWDGQKLIAISIEELRDMAERDALLAEITGRRDTGHQDDPAQDTRAITGRPAAGRPALPAGASRTGGVGQGTPDRGTSPATNGTQDAGQRRTQDGADDTGARRTPNTDEGTADPNGHGTQDGGGTQDAGQDSRRTGPDNADDIAIDAALLKKADLALIAMAHFDGKDGRPHWATAASPPSVRAINTAIDAYRKRTEGPDAKFNSKDIAGLVQKLLIRMREKPGLIDLVRLAAEGDTPN